MYPRLFQLGPVALPTYGVLTALAIIAGLTLASHLAPRYSLDPQKIWNAGLIGVFTSFIGARFLLIALHFRDFIAYPVWMLGLISLRGEGFVLGGITLGLCAALAYLLASRQPFLRVLDCCAPPLLLGLAIQSIGCFVAGCEYGLPTNLPWAVTYRDRISALWYQTPLVLPLHPVQLYYTVFYLLLFALLLSAPFRKLRAGELAGTALFFFGLGGPLLGLFIGGAPTVTVWTQVAGVLAILAGGALWLRPKAA